MRTACFSNRWRAHICGGLMLGAGMLFPVNGAPQTPVDPLAIEVTTVRQIQLLASQTPNASYSIRLEGDVWWANPAQGKFVLMDDSGAVELEMDLHGQVLQAGRRVRLEGESTITRRGAGFQLGAVGPVVDNNGIHSMIEKSGAVFLKAGRQPIRVDWFNGLEKFGLEIQYEGPGLPRQSIPDGALFRLQPPSGDATNFVNGLDYACYDAPGEVLPDFDQLAALKTGTVSNFDVSVIPRTNHIGVRFTGWLNVPRDGLYTFHTKSDDGSQLFVGGPTLPLKTIGNAAFPAPRKIVPGQILNDDEDCQWVKSEGTVTFASRKANALELELNSGVGTMRVEIANDSGLPPGPLLNNRIRATGVCQGALADDGQKIAGTLLVSDAKDVELLEANQNASEILGTNSLPLLTTGAEVHGLSREEAQRGYPVKMRGVVTCVLPERQAFTIQDSTRGVYAVDLSESRSAPPQIGEFLDIEGTTDPGLFAPIVNASRIKILGAGRLPEPVRPTWDQLLNGSLDAQYVELQGIVTAVATNGVTLLTRDGRIKLELRVNGVSSESLVRYEDALVRIRGILLASWDYVTHEVKAGELRIYGADLSVDQPAPADLFALPPKTVAQLRLFDPQAGAFERVKISGQILHARGAEYFMTDGTKGLRFIAKKNPDLAAGDRVEVVGYPQWSGAAPVLREAVARKIGAAPMPPAKDLPADNLVQSDYDATRVRVQGVLVGWRETASEQILEMQNGVRIFIARLDGNNKFSPPPVGSRMELTGTYSGQGGDKAVGQDISSFELLLNSSAGVQVLSRPPWWTLERLLVAVGALVCGLAFTALWITQLHREVEWRTVELEAQIRERQRVEQQRAMEQERARVAQDLHDELGSNLTEISMLSARARAASASDERRRHYLEQMGQKAREMVTALDEIVWAMNPRHDSLASLVSYFCLYADRFLGLANIAWRLEDSSDTPGCAVDSRLRHQLFLAFKEALTNVVRHSGATEVRLSIRRQDREVRLSIADNGRGMPPGTRTEEMDGVANMRARLEKLGGRFEITSEAGGGTVVNFYAPAN